MSIIKKITAREILDSRGNSTIEANVLLIVAFWAGRPCPRALPPAARRPLSLGTEIKSVIWARGS